GELGVGVAPLDQLVVEVGTAGVAGAAVELRHLVFLLGLLEVDPLHLPLQEAALLLRPLGVVGVGGLDELAGLGDPAGVVVGPAGAHVLAINGQLGGLGGQGAVLVAGVDLAEVVVGLAIVLVVELDGAAQEQSVVGQGAVDVV